MLYLLFAMKVLIFLALLFFVVFQFNFWKTWKDKRIGKASWQSVKKHELLSTFSALGGWIVCSVAGIFITECLEYYYLISGFMMVLAVIALIVWTVQLWGLNVIWIDYANNAALSCFDILEMKVTKFWYVMFMTFIWIIAFLRGYLQVHMPLTEIDDALQIVMFLI